jgi:hypothetical protein
VQFAATKYTMSSPDSENAALGHRYLLRRPKALQYFDAEGKLSKASDEERQAGRFELFLDLLYVALVSVVS